MKFLVSKWTPGIKNLVIICWFYAKNFIFVHITEKIFWGDWPFFGDSWTPLAPKVEVLEPPLLQTCGNLYWHLCWYFIKHQEVVLLPFLVISLHKFPLPVLLENWRKFSYLTSCRRVWYYFSLSWLIDCISQHFVLGICLHKGDITGSGIYCNQVQNAYIKASQFRQYSDLCRGREAGQDAIRYSLRLWEI